MRVVCVVGLPGSGKTHYLQQFYSSAWVVDDPSPRFRLPAPEVVAHVPGHIWIADTHLCDPQVRAACARKIHAHYGVYPEWVFFENDPEQCKANVRARADHRQVMGMIWAMHQVYEIPEGAQVLPVYRGDKADRA